MPAQEYGIAEKGTVQAIIDALLHFPHRHNVQTGAALGCILEVLCCTTVAQFTVAQFTMAIVIAVVETHEWCPLLTLCATWSEKEQMGCGIHTPWLFPRLQELLHRLA